MDQHVSSPDRFRRAVFYLAGFDIIGPRFYHLLLRRGLAKDSALHGRTYRMVEVPSRQPAARTWQVSTEDRGTPVDVSYFLLTPHEHIAPSYRNNALHAARSFVEVGYAYLRHGVLKRMVMFSWKTALVFLYVMSLLAAFFLVGFGGALLPLALLPVNVSLVLMLACGLIAGLATLQLGLCFDKRTFANFLLSSMSLSVRHTTGHRPDLDRSIDEYARCIIDLGAASRWNEILIVGHSSGTIMAVDVMAQILARSRLAFETRLSLLTLGSTDGIATYFRRAARQRAAFAQVAASRDVKWVEYYSPFDFVCFGRADPLVAAAIALDGRAHGPIKRMLDLNDFYSPGRMRSLGFNLFERHFDYLKAGDRISDYSYFRLVCGAQTLDDRVAADAALPA